MERKIAEQSKAMGGVHNSQAKHIAIQKQIMVLENRLDNVSINGILYSCTAY